MTRGLKRVKDGEKNKLKLKLPEGRTEKRMRSDREINSRMKIVIGSMEDL